MQLQKAIWLLCFLAPACASSETTHRRHIETWQEARAKSMPSPVEGAADSTSLALSTGAGLPELLSHARRNNPRLRAAFHAWRASIEQIPQASKLPEPRVMFGAFLEKVETRTGPMQGKLSIAQALPWFGKRRLAGDVAAAKAQALAQAVEVAYLAVDLQVKDAWYEYAWLQKTIQVDRAHRELLSHWQNVARTRMELALSKPSEILRVEIELGKLEDRLMSLNDLQRPLRAKLNAVLNRPAGAPLPVPQFPLSVPEVVDTDRLLADLDVTNPGLRQLQHRIAAAELAVQLADKAGYPDLSLGVDYTFIGSNDAAGSGDDAVALTVGLGLPIWRGAYRAKQDGARAHLKMARANLDAARNGLIADLEMALFKLRDTSRHLELLNTSLIPKGQEAIGIMGDTYQSGESNFIEVVDAQRILLEFQLQAVRAEVDRAKALSKVEQLSGVSIPLVDKL